jgi:uncharacterized protein YndB with AHSA1/START domain
MVLTVPKEGTDMAAIIRDLTLAVSAKRVFDALTRQQEIARWWTDDLNVKIEIGFIAEFRFQKWGGGVLQFEILELDPNEIVSWVVRGGPGEWAGTSVTWRLHPLSIRETRLIFTHDGFVRADSFYENSRKNWDFVLASLKSYLVTGYGTPGAPPFLR